MLRFTGLQRVRHDLGTEQQQQQRNHSSRQFRTGLQLDAISVPNTELRLFQIASDLKHLTEANKDHFKGRDHSRSVLQRKKITFLCLPFVIDTAPKM